MLEQEQMIDQFKEKYLAQLRRWSTLVSAEDLDRVDETLKALDAESRVITERLQAQHSVLYSSVWVPLLKHMMVLLPNIENHLLEIRNQARTETTTITRGARGVSAYRRAMSTQIGHFERNG